jgi:hypothetical protein
MLAKSQQHRDVSQVGYLAALWYPANEVIHEPVVSTLQFIAKVFRRPIVVPVILDELVWLADQGVVAPPRGRPNAGRDHSIRESQQVFDSHDDGLKEAGWFT